MLAYLFWHYPAPEASREEYERRLAAFHESLAASPSSGFLRSASYRVAALPWVDGSPVYEDWYELAGSEGLDPLDRAAVGDALRSVHDALAERAGGGAGGLYRLVRPGPDAGVESVCAWLDKPRGVPYADFLARLEVAPLWQRQMVLGPAREFCAVAPVEGALLVRRTRVWPQGR